MTGHPTGAAWHFAAALRENPEPAAFRSTKPRAEPSQAPTKRQMPCTVPGCSSSLTQTPTYKCCVGAGS